MTMGLGVRALALMCIPIISDGSIQAIGPQEKEKKATKLRTRATQARGQGLEASPLGSSPSSRENPIESPTKEIVIPPAPASRRTRRPHRSTAAMATGVTTTKTRPT